MDLNLFTRSIILGDERRGGYYRDTPEDLRFNSGFRIDQTDAFRLLQRYSRNESITRTLLSATFWDLLTATSFYDELLTLIGKADPIQSGGKVMLTNQSDSRGANRFDLLILSPEIIPESSFALSLGSVLRNTTYNRRDYFNNYTVEALSSAANRINQINQEAKITSRNTRNDILLTSYQIFRNSAYLFNQLLETDFRIICAPMPKTIATSGIPESACGIALDEADKPISSIGVIARKSDGRIGVTGAFHGMHKDPNALAQLYRQKGASCLVGKTVYIGGKKGLILDVDQITDSCFIGMDERDLPRYTSSFGPLTDRPPYRTERVHFDGLTSAKVMTNVTEVDLGIPMVDSGRQHCVYTKPVTNRGDSGSALINERNEVIGFAYRRTAYDAPLEYSEWIWADSVYKNLQIGTP